MPLLRTPRAKDDESYSGHLLRLANDNGFQGIAAMGKIFLGTAVAGRPSSSVLLRMAEMTVEDLANYLRVHPSALPARPLAPTFLQWGLRRRKTYSDLGWPNTAAWCPRCLNENPYWRVSWDSPLSAACTTHGLRLLRRCPSCGRAVSCKRVQLLHCLCGRSLVNALAERPTVEELSFQGRLEDPASGGSVYLAEAKALPFVVQAQTLSCTLNVLMGLGLARPYHRGDYVAEAARTERGKQFLLNPDRSVQEAIVELSKRRRLAARRPRLLPERMPAVVSRWLDGVRLRTRTNCPDDSGFDWQHSTADAIRQRGYATAVDLSRHFGFNRFTWRGWIDEGLFPSAIRRDERSRSIRTLPAETVDDLTIMFRSTLSVTEAAGRLRLLPFQVQGLEKLGALPRCFKKGGYALRRYRICDIAAILDLLEALAEPADGRALSSNKLERLPHINPAESRGRRFHQWMRRMYRVLSGIDPILRNGSVENLGFNAFLAPTMAPVLPSPNK